MDNDILGGVDDDGEDMGDDDEGVEDALYADDDDEPENPVTTRAEEARVEQMPRGTVRPGNPPTGTNAGTATLRVTPQSAPATRSLVMVFGNDGSPRVAMTVNGRRVEDFRAPTAAEWELFKAQGRFVKGGLSGEVAITPQESGPGGFLKAHWGKLVVLLAAAGGGYWAWKSGVLQKIGAGGVDGEQDDEDEDIEV